MTAKIDLLPEFASIDIPDGVYAETVTEVQHYTDRLFRFKTTRTDAFRFRSGEFVMIGLPDGANPVYRAYSIASPNWDDQLEFYSIKVPGGPLTERLQEIQPGAVILVRKKATGTLVNDALLPGRRLWMFSTGTGIAPFASLIRDPETYEKFEQIILTHTCRDSAELEYGRHLISTLKSDPLIGSMAAALRFYATTTRTQSENTGRVTDLLNNGKIYRDLDVPEIDSATDRAMICGSREMIAETKLILQGCGLSEGSNNQPGTFVVERAFVG